MIEFKRLIEDQELGQLYLYFLTKMNQSDTVEDNRGEPFVLPAGCFVSNYSNIAHELKSTRKKVTPRIEMLREMGLIALNNFPKPGDTFRARLRDESGHTLDKVFIVLNHTLNVLETQKRAQLEAQVQAHVLVQLEKTEEKIVLDSPPKPENSLPHTPSLNNSSKILNIAPPIERNEIESESKAFAQSAEPIVAAGSFFSEEDHSEEVNVLAGGKDKLEPQLEIQGLTQEPVVDTKPVKEITPEQKRNIERALWRDGLWKVCKFYYLDRGLDPDQYPKLTGQTNGILNNYIEKYGHGDWCLGTKWVMVFIWAALERFDKQRERNYSGDYWKPTLDNILQKKKIAEIEAEDGSGGYDPLSQYDLAEIPETAEEFRQMAINDLLNQEKYLTESQG